ncbi:MAG: DUF4383 domain-containing protein, partial [Gemmatimonadaceae bacterium]
DGIWGFFSPITFGVLSTNTLHTVIHLLMGIAGIYTARTSGARLWSMAIGLVVLSVGVLYFVPGIGPLLISLFNLNQSVAILNIVVGVIALLVARNSKTTFNK